MKIKYSIITFNWGDDRINHMNTFLRSFKLNSNNRKDIELIIVEKGSNFFEPKNETYYKYHQFSNSTNYNRAKSINEGAKIAQGEYLIFHDNDIPIPQFFFDHLDNITNYSLYKYFSNFKLLYNISEKETKLVFKNPEKYNFGYDFVDENSFRDLTFDHVINGKVRVFGANGVAGGSTTIEKKLFNTVGGMNKNFTGWGGEDNEIEQRVKYYLSINNIQSANQHLIHLYHTPYLISENNSSYAQNLNVLEKTMINPEEVIKSLIINE